MYIGYARLKTDPEGIPRLVVKPKGTNSVLDVRGALEAKGENDLLWAESPKSLLEAGDSKLALVNELLSTINTNPLQNIISQHSLNEDKLDFLPPVPNPEKFLCVGKNYSGHLEELKRTNLIKEIPNEPTGFIKLNNVLVGQDAVVERPQEVVKFDYEPELSFVISKPCFRVNKDDALNYVGGITLFNDLTDREVQKREVVSGTKFWIAKNMPGFGPVGPYIITLDEVNDPNDLWITCDVNGERRMRFNTSGQIFKMTDIIAHFSRYLPLKPGDMFSTGSAPGVAVGQLNADDLYLKPGDQCEIAFENLMSLRTRVS